MLSIMMRSVTEIIVRVDFLVHEYITRIKKIDIRSYNKCMNASGTILLHVFVEGLYSVKTDISRPITETVDPALDPPISIIVPRLVDQMAFAPVTLLSVVARSCERSFPVLGSKTVNKLMSSGTGVFESKPSNPPMTYTNPVVGSTVAVWPSNAT